MENPPEGGGRTPGPQQSFRKRPRATHVPAFLNAKVTYERHFMQKFHSRGSPLKTVNYKGWYLVTENGQIFSVHNKRMLSFRQQKTRSNGHGYLRACIHQKDEYVHRIVATCFIDNPNGSSEVNHIDGNKQNNSADNLEWCTRLGNNRHAFRIGLRTNSEMSLIAHSPRWSRRRFSPEDISEIRQMQTDGISDYKISKKFNCRPSQLYQIRIGKSYKDSINA